MARPWRGVLPLGKRRGDARKGTGRAVLLHRIACRRRREGARVLQPLSSIVGSAAEARAESVPMTNIDRIDRAPAGADGEPAGVHVDGDDLSGWLRRRPWIEPHADDLRNEGIGRRVRIRRIASVAVEADIE